MLDMLWMNHLEHMESLRDSVRLRAYAQHDPLAEYRQEGRLLFQRLLGSFEQWMEENKEKLEQLTTDTRQRATTDNGQMLNIPPTARLAESGNGQKIGRNDPCPCGSGKKYKKCHGK